MVSRFAVVRDCGCNKLVEHLSGRHRQRYIHELVISPRFQSGFAAVSHVNNRCRIGFAYAVDPILIPHGKVLFKLLARNQGKLSEEMGGKCACGSLALHLLKLIQAN